MIIHNQNFYHRCRDAMRTATYGQISGWEEDGPHITASIGHSFGPVECDWKELSDPITRRVRQALQAAGACRIHVTVRSFCEIDVRFDCRKDYETQYASVPKTEFDKRLYESLQGLAL